MHMKNRLYVLIILSALVVACGGTGQAPTVTPTPPVLTLSVFPEGSGRVEAIPPRPQGGYRSGTNLILTAIPGPGFQFLGWAGDTGGLTNPASIAIQSNMSV